MANILYTNGFLFFGNNGYEVTEKGRDFLEKYSDFSSKYSKAEGEFQRMLFEREELEKMCQPMKNNQRRPILARRRCS